MSVARTLRELSRPPLDFHVINKLVADRGDVHHLVVGHTGVFAIETASTDGALRSDAGQRKAHRAEGCEQLLRMARRGAMLVSERLRLRGFKVGVQPILCLPLADLDRPRYVGGVIVVTGGAQLDYLIRHWPGQTLSGPQTARVIASLQTRVHRVAA